MKKSKILFLNFILLLAIGLGGCTKEESATDYTLQTLDEIQWQEISNAIPAWVEETSWDKSLYAVSEAGLDEFDEYALETFPSFCDAQWTQQQSDAVCLGSGIRMFVLDGTSEVNKIVYYPVILNGIIVGGYQVYQSDEEMGMQESPLIVNQLNALMDLTSETNPVILGYNNENIIAIIGNDYYILDEDHLEHQQVDTSKIPAINTTIYVDAMSVICTERTASVDEWTMANGN